MVDQIAVVLVGLIITMRENQGKNDPHTEVRKIAKELLFNK